MDTVFITGGGSGIGAGLAEAFHQRGAKVIIAGRDAAKLEKTAARFRGMETLPLDVSDAVAVGQAAESLATKHPALNVVINNAGIQQIVDFSSAPVELATLDREIDINLKGLLYVTAAFLPLLRSQPAARLVQVSSGLAFVPLVRAPIYSATKAAIHSFCISLREQLRETSLQVVELIPPVVQTDLHDGQTRQPPRAMPLEQFTAEAMRGLASGADEIAVGLAKVLKTGSRIAPGRLLKIVNAKRD